MKADKITRDILRSLRDGQSVTVECRDGADLQSQRNTAYGMRLVLDRRMRCTADGPTLTVTKCKGE